MKNFLRSQAVAFTARHGVARALLYDDLKNAVLERRGGATRFPSHSDRVGRSLSLPTPTVAVTRGSEKGRVDDVGDGGSAEVFA